MATQPLQSDTLRLDRFFRSDMLPTLRSFFDASPELKSLVERRLLQLRVIVDANRVYAELLWRLRRRENSRNRSGLEEAIDAGVLVLIAPDFLKLEIEEHLQRIADQAGATFAQAQREWELFRVKLCFYRPLSEVTDGAVADPKDLPYKHASDELALPVYTRDLDLQKMGAPVVWVCIDTVCRDHARATSVKLGFTVGSTYTVTIGVEALRAVAREIKSLFGGFRRLSPWLQFAIAGGVAAALIHPKSRTKLLEGLEFCPRCSNEVQRAIVPRVLGRDVSTCRSRVGREEGSSPDSKRASTCPESHSNCLCEKSVRALPSTTSDQGDRTRNAQ